MSMKDSHRRLARKRYWERHNRETYTCPDCGRAEEQVYGKFEVHHQGGSAYDNRIENLVGLCRMCHNLREGKKPSLREIEALRDQVRNSRQREEEVGAIEDIRSIYLAGTMNYHEKNSEDSYWNSSVAKSYWNGWRDVIGDMWLEINSPRDLHFNHGGDLVEGVAGCDLELIDASDSVLAYFDKREQIGTITELMYALSKGKPALVLFDSKFVATPSYRPI